MKSSPYIPRLSLIVSLLSVSFLSAETASLFPVMDNSIYEESDNSNGSGVYIYSGKTGPNAGQNPASALMRRRAFIQFDLSSVPAGATINSASLTLIISKDPGGITPEHTFTLHRVTKAWGEGSSNAGFPGGFGTTPATGDATWNFAIFNTSTWNTPGGDFVATASSSHPVGGDFALDEQTWTGQGLADDVQFWLNNPSSNFGWVLVGPEIDKSARRFYSRETTNAIDRPLLTIDYTLPPSTWAGYTIEADGRTVDTGAYMGVVDIAAAPWIWVYDLETYVYLPEDHVTPNGGWSFVPN